jgi:2-isopropylmalate synthase
MDPSEVGIPSNHIVLGKHSGRHAFKDRLNQFGYELSDEDFQIAFVKFKELCDKKKYIFDEDIFSLINEEFMRLSDFYQLESVECSSGTEVKPRATIVVNVDGELIEAEESGAGPMDSVFKAISKVVGITPILDSYSVASVTEGMDAQAEVSVSIKHDDFFARGKGANTDVIVASAKAFINALNNLRWRKNHPKIASTKGV